jgi:YD repeat-containing protein
MPSNPAVSRRFDMNTGLKRICWLLVLVLPLVNCCKTERIEVSERYDNGRKKIVCRYAGKGELSKLVERVEYNEAGRVIKVEDRTHRTVKHIQWHKNGNKKRENSYKEGKKEGAWRRWFSGGQIKNEKIYSQGKLVRDTSYEREIITDTLYRDGRLYIAREYRDGILAMEKTFREGKLVKARWYYPDGRIMEERGYREGKKSGRWVYWDRNGEKRRETFYREENRGVE